MQIIGVDLSGPGSPQNTALAAFRLSDQDLEYDALITSVDDKILFKELAERLKEGDICIGLDAPLSYGVSGGQRRSDKELRERVMETGLPPGSVMAPTAPRMAYLTLRGLGVARGLRFLGGPGHVEVVETHPGAALALGGAPIDSIRGFRDGLNDRRVLLSWLAERGLKGLDENILYTDHSVAACAAAWAAWLWKREESHWLFPGEPPHHPFDFAC